MPHIEVHVLGQPTVSVDRMVASLPGRQLPLALRLALSKHVPVSRQRLLELWPEPVRTDGALRVALTRLRHAIGTHTIQRLENGYVMAPTADVDAQRFEDLLNASSDSAIAVKHRLQLLDEAIGLWDGPAFAGLEAWEWSVPEAVRLDALFEQAIDLRFELRMDNGEDIVSELSADLRRQPTRERRVEMLATSLYRSGRQTDALSEIRRTRRLLREEYGLSPGSQLQALEARILGHDPSLLAVPPPATTSSVTSPADTTPGAGQVERSMRAARGLLAAGAPSAALDTLTSTETDARRSQPAETLADHLLLLAQAKIALGSSDPNSLIDEAQAIARAVHDGELLARAALLRFKFGIANDKAGALIELAEPLDSLEPLSEQRLQLICASAVILSLTDGADGARELVAAAAECHDAIGSVPSEIVWRSAEAIVGSVDLGTVDNLVSHAERALALARSHGDPTLLTVAIQAILRTAWLSGNTDLVDSVTDELDSSSRRSGVAFGTVRASLASSMSALARGDLDRVPGLIARARDDGDRLQTHVVEAATRSQEMLLLRERLELDPVVPMMRQLTSLGPHWLAAAAAFGDRTDADALVAVLRGIDGNVGNDLSSSVSALGAIAAERHGNRELATWCIERLRPLHDLTITSGFGTVVLGFARHHLGLALIACDRFDEAATEFEWSARRSGDAGARLWQVESTLWLVEALLRGARSANDDTALIVRAEELLDDLAGNEVFAQSKRLASHLAGLRQTIAA